jgi:type IV pilus assembly protein PilA
MPSEIGNQIATNLTEGSPSSPSNRNKVRKMRNQRGFSLIELLIVVAIILIIAAIAIPNLLRARIAANESSAANSIRQVNTAQVTYESAYPATGYASTMISLGPPAATGCPGIAPTAASACLIDWLLANATAVLTPKSGYYFGIGNPGGGPPNLGYTVGGAPGGFSQSGTRGFCSVEDGVIHYDPTHNAPPTTTAAACQSAPYIQLNN